MGANDPLLKQRSWSDSLYRKAVEFHGHGGPFMVVGLRMGLHALKALDSTGWFGLSCRVKLKISPPDSCVVDGVQCSTGCTMGKRNIVVEDGVGVSSEFLLGDRVLRISLKSDVLDMMRADLALGHGVKAGGGEVGASCMRVLMDASDEELFSVEEHEISYAPQ